MKTSPSQASADYGTAFPSSRKVYDERVITTADGPVKIRVPFREVALSGGEPPVRLYDTSGPQGDTTDTTPTFSWQPPANLPASTYTYEIAVYGGNPSNTELWSGRFPSNTLSVDYNADNEASMTTLAPGSYTWTIQIVDAIGNKGTMNSSFSVIPP